MRGETPSNNAWERERDRPPRQMIKEDYCWVEVRATLREGGIERPSVNMRKKIVDICQSLWEAVREEENKEDKLYQ